MERPETRYVDVGGINIAYQRFGEGSPAIVYTPPWVSNCDLQWDIEEHRRVSEFGARYNEILVVDKRGVGLSDRTDVPPTPQDRIDDTIAVLDAEGIERAAFIGQSEGAFVALAAAAQHPERASHVVLIGPGTPGLTLRDLAPLREPEDPEFAGIEAFEDILDHWGTADSVTTKYMSPSVSGDPRFEEWQRRFERLSASPGALRTHLQAATTGDVRQYLDVGCPVMIAYSRRDPIVPPATSRWYTSKFPDAEVRVWDDDNHVWQLGPNWRQCQADIIEFVNGSRPEPVSTSRFGVVLFTDIVDSTRLSAEQGDAAWAMLIRAHDATADRVIGARGGRRVKSTGDGLLAVFPDPESAVTAAQELVSEIGVLGIEIRAGLHAGQVEHHDDGDITGIAVNLAARIEASGDPGDVRVSATLRDLLAGTGVSFEDVGDHEFKGFDAPVAVHRVA